jgi:hypothetical protein
MVRSSKGGESRALPGSPVTRRLAAAQGLGQYPQGAIEFHVLVNAVNGAGSCPAPLLVAATQAALDGVFLHAVERGPEIACAVFGTARHQQLRRRDRGRAFGWVVAVGQGRHGERFLLFLAQVVVLHVVKVGVDLLELAQHLIGTFDNVVNNVNAAAVAHFLIHRHVAQDQPVSAHETELAGHHLVAAAAVVAVQQNDFVRFLAHDVAGMAQANHVLGVLAFVGVADAGLARHERLKTFGAQRIEHLDGWNVQVTFRTAVVRFLGKDRGRHAGNLVIGQRGIAADHARITEVAGKTHFCISFADSRSGCRRWCPGCRGGIASTWLVSQIGRCRQLLVKQSLTNN